MIKGAIWSLDEPLTAVTTAEPIARLWPIVFSCMIAAFATFLLLFRLGDTRAPIWDEAYYLTSTARYHEGRAQFASHPPLGLMLIAAGDAVSGRNRDFDWRGMAAVKSIKAEQVPAGFDYLGPRLAPALFGALAAGLFYLLMFELTGSAVGALLPSSLFLLDAALIAQFRAAQLDAFQISFALAAILCAIRALRRNGLGWTFGFGLALGCAALVKLNALMLGGMAPFILWPALRQGEWRALGCRITAGLGGSLSALLLVGAAYVSVSPLPPDSATEAGRKDLLFISEEHRAAIETGTWTPASALAALEDHARFIGSDLAGIPKADANASHPWQWLIGKGAITYRWDRSSDTISLIGSVPNLTAWLISLLGIGTCLLPGRLRGNPVKQMLLAGWIANMAALQWLDAQRVLYLYHYFLPLLLGHLLAAMEWRRRGLPEGIGFAALAIVTLNGAMVLPLALNHSVSVARCQQFLRDCGSG